MEVFDPHATVPEWDSLSDARKIEIIEEFSKPTSDNSVFLDKDSGVVLHSNPHKSIRILPKFKPEYTSLVFNENGEHEDWEQDPSAPKEMILSYVSPQDKGRGATDYDLTDHPEPFTCPRNPT